MQNNILTVTQLNKYVKSIIESDYQLKTVLMRAEISNYTNHYKSGHLYMTLKDSSSLIRAVMFRSYASHLKFEPQDGMSVIVTGSVSLYERDGQYQFYITDMQPDGAGALQIAYEQLKEKLAKEGMFAEESKKPIVTFPKKIGVITSPTGAAVRDIFSILNRRYPLAEVDFYPVHVQGEKAPPDIVTAITRLDLLGLDTIIVGRGGGSIEDLWCFNDESVARAIFNANTPIISAVGHETDFTIADFVADLRAPTPSAAAELAVPDISNLVYEIRSKKAHIASIVEARIEQGIYNIEYRKSKVASSVESIINQKLALNDSMSKKLSSDIKDIMYNKRSMVNEMLLKLDMLSPAKKMIDGYCKVTKDNKEIQSVKEISIGDDVSIYFKDGVANATITTVDKSKQPENMKG